MAIGSVEKTRSGVMLLLREKTRPPGKGDFMRRIRCAFGLFFLTAPFVMAGCSTSQPIVSEWSNSNYVSPAFKRILVGAIGGQPSIRRNLEDEFVAQLRSDGVEAVPSYRSIPEDETLDEAKLKRAAREARADAVILARLVNVEQKTQIGPSYYPVPSFGFFGPHFGASWYGAYGEPYVYRYNVYTSEAQLLDLNRNELVWTGTLKTTELDNVPTAIKSYAQAVIKALEQKNLLAARR